MASRGTYTAKIVSVVSLLHDFSLRCLEESGPRERGPRGTGRGTNFSGRWRRNGRRVLGFRPRAPVRPDSGRQAVLREPPDLLGRRRHVDVIDPQRRQRVDQGVDNGGGLCLDSAGGTPVLAYGGCLLYTSDAADEL